MWPFQPNKIRRRNGRKPKADRAPGGPRPFRLAGGTWQLLIAVAFFALSTLAIVTGQRGPRYRLGEQVTQPITARVEFDWIDERQAEQAAEHERRHTENYYRLNVALFDRLQEGLEQLKTLATQAGSLEELQTLIKDTPWSLDEAALQWLQSYGWLERPLRLTLNRFSEGEIRLINPPTSKQRSPASQADKAILLPKPDDPNVIRPVLRSELLDVNDSSHRQKACTQLAELFPEVLHTAVEDFFARLIQPDPALKEFHPLFVFDAQRTMETIAANVERARERAIKRFAPGDVIVGPGVIDEEEMALIGLEASSYERYLGSDAAKAVALRRGRMRAQLGMAGLVAMLVLGLAVFVVRYQRRVAHNPMRCLALACLMLAIVLLARLAGRTIRYDELAVGLMLIPAAVLTIAYTQRFAFGICAALCVLVTLALRADFGLFITLLAPMSIAVLMLERIRNRWKLIKVAFAAALLALVVRFCVGALEQTETWMALRYAAVAGASVLLGGFLIQVIIPVVEWAFKIATPLTLLEWSDTNNPLLRRLAIEAPGTLRHSELVGQLGEAAAEAIAADGLLVRVGALYHDIGKMNKPQFFIENQESAYSHHAKLQPGLSHMIIVSHVKDGLEMAKEAGLPVVLHAFITEHHGTTVVKYFHHAASEKQAGKASGRHDRQVSDTEFRYPGPRPQSRETAILMLADAAEGTVRALAEPTAARITGAVHGVLMDRLYDGQLTECNITMKDLQLVEESLIKNLSAVYHRRVAYPTKEEAHPRAEGESPERPEQVDAGQPVGGRAS